MKTGTTEGSPALDLGRMGIGTNVWGRGGKPLSGVLELFDAAMAAGIRLIDSAEIYQGGGSERSIGSALAERRAGIATAAQPVILSKFFPWPWRLSRSSLESALKGSLGRLGLARLDLYLLHFPLPPIPLETWVTALGDAVEARLARSVGVSNCDSTQVRKAHEVLAKRGIALACDEVEYSLLNRRSELNGTISACRELGVAVIAYRPLGSGILPASSPTIPGLRKLMAPKTDAKGLQDLRSLLLSIGESRGGKTAAQVALNWTMTKGTIPIPGARTIAHLAENVGALDWKLDAGEIEALERAADRATGTR
jgi:aryl-alcohol dehydrogenase-like predicted oxidoreductase